jgi:hypothetical protein
MVFIWTQRHSLDASRRFATHSGCWSRRVRPCATVVSSDRCLAVRVPGCRRDIRWSVRQALAPKPPRRTSVTRQVMHITTAALKHLYYLGMTYGISNAQRSQQTPLAKNIEGARKTAMKHGDHVRIMGSDGLYVFLKEVQGMAALRVSGRKRPEDTTLDIPIDQVVSLEQIDIPCPHPSDC